MQFNLRIHFSVGFVLILCIRYYQKLPFDIDLHSVPIGEKSKCNSDGVGNWAIAEIESDSLQSIFDNEFNIVN